MGIDYSLLYRNIVRLYSLIPRYLGNGWGFRPIQVFAEVTYQCNLRCEFCQFLRSEEPLVKPGATQLSIEEFKAILSEVPTGGLISFTGGEPFVRKGFLKLVGEVSRRNKTHIFTNGTLITEEAAKYLIKLGARHSLTGNGLVAIGISLEGLEKTHNQIVGRDWAFQRTLMGIESLIKYKQNKKYPIIELKVVISQKNVGELYKLFCLAKDLRVDIFNIMTMNMLPHASRIVATDTSYMQPPPQVEEVNLYILKKELQSIEKEAKHSMIQIRTTPQGISFKEILSYYENRFCLKDYTCYFPWYGVGITAYGDVVICPYVNIGNLKKGKLKKLFNNDKAREFRKKLRKYGIFPGCLGCCLLTRK